uniref:Major facilitator superfamily (MFS) profile domain-containing protein n=1 Tax=Octopus bimaculoides TaxID=37653 RepID=A0A0L8GNR4_OCTBM
MLVLTSHSTLQHFEGEFEWSNTLQSNILACYFYGYISTNILAGILANKYGGKRVLGGSLLFASILTILHPSLSRISGYLTIVLRILTGLVSAPMFPAILSLMGLWAPPSERGLLIGITFAGQVLGNIVGFVIFGYLCEYGFDNGWGSIFYTSGVTTLIFSFVWYYVVYDNPDLHPISQEEHAYLSRTITCEKAIIFGLFGYNWGANSLQLLLPLYIKEALNVNAASNGIISSAPSIGEAIALPLWGKLADMLRSKNYMSTHSVRVLFQTVALVACASLLIIMGYLRCDQIILICIFLFLCGASLSLSCSGVVANNIEIAPNYAGVIYGLANTVSALSGSFSSLCAKALTTNATQSEWQIVFVLCGAVLVSGAILFVVLVRTEIQDWASPEGSEPSVNPKDGTKNESLAVSSRI